jgi:hypothetical protein
MDKELRGAFKLVLEQIEALQNKLAVVHKELRELKKLLISKPEQPPTN